MAILEEIGAKIASIREKVKTLSAKVADFVSGKVSQAATSLVEGTKVVRDYITEGIQTAETAVRDVAAGVSDHIERGLERGRELYGYTETEIKKPLFEGLKEGEDLSDYIFKKTKEAINTFIERADEELKGAMRAVGGAIADVVTLTEEIILPHIGDVPGYLAVLIGEIKTGFEEQRKAIEEQRKATEKQTEATNKMRHAFIEAMMPDKEKIKEYMGIFTDLADDLTKVTKERLK